MVYFGSAPQEVTQLVVDVISNSSILVRWSPPAHTNGLLTYYTIVVFNKLTGYNFSSQVDSSSMDEEEVAISGLSMSCICNDNDHGLSDCMCVIMHSGAFVSYTVQVFASTEAGRGNPATSVIYTRHGGKSVTDFCMGSYVCICMTLYVCVCVCVCTVCVSVLSNQKYIDQRHKLMHTVPAVPTLLSVHRLSGSLATVDWIPLTQDEARGLLTSFKIAYEPVLNSTLNCSNLEFVDSETVIFMRENLFEQGSASITSLEPSREYCIAIRASTSGGDSGFSNSIKLSCKIFSIEVIE